MIHNLSTNKKKKILKIGILLIIVLAILVLYLVKDKEQEKNHKLANTYHVALGEATFTPGEIVTVDVLAGQFPGEYPALSYELVFDKTQLEFLQLKQGNITICNQNTQEKILPEWSYQKDIANRDGKISTMYLDMTAGEAPFQFEETTKEKNVLFRIDFKVRDSCSKGDNIEIKFSQATFATLNEDNSISMQKNNVKYRDGSYVVE